MFQYRHQTFYQVSEIVWDPRFPAQAAQWFDMLVMRQKPFSADPTTVPKYFGIAEEVETGKHVGFCFAYCDIETKVVELAGVFVDSEARNLGVALKLLSEAISVFYLKLEVRSFNLRFIQESARESRLPEALRMLALRDFKEAEFHLYYPEEPRHESIGI